MKFISAWLSLFCWCYAEHRGSFEAAYRESFSSSPLESEVLGFCRESFLVEVLVWVSAGEVLVEGGVEVSSQ